MGTVGEIFKQFNHGDIDGEWHQFINKIKISNIHGWTGQEMIFKYPVVAIVGVNGIGKSTFLKAAVCAYENDNGNAKSFYPSKMFMNTHWDGSELDGATIEYNVRNGNEVNNLKWRKTKEWGFTPKKGKPKRKVYFLEISRTLPLDATAGYAKVAVKANTETVGGKELNGESIKKLSYVLGQAYTSARFTSTVLDENKEVGILTKYGKEISQFHQGAGEDSVLDMFKLLQDMPNYSLLVIDEVENSLHPLAQRRLVKYLLELAKKKKLQIILSTHSPFVLEELPEQARIMLVQLNDRKDILYNVSCKYALSNIDDKTHSEIYVHLEDKEAETIFWELMKSDEKNYDSWRCKIATQIVGSYSVVKTLCDLGKQKKLPYKSISIVDGDKKEECPNCLSLPGDTNPEELVFNDLKKLDWHNLDARFGIGAGTLFKYLDDAVLLDDHHQWTTYVGDKVKKSKDTVWQVLVEEWCEQVLTDERKREFIQLVNEEIVKANH